jgi:outer membrane murein-binding lipoprotein Lpp
MTRIMIAAAAVSATLLLGGCATTIRSDVTTFNQWPAQLSDKSYAFAQAAAQDNTLELQSYENLVRGQLNRLGFHESPQSPALRVAMRFQTVDVPTQVLYPSFAPMYPYSARFAYLGGRRRYWGGWYSPFYDPLWGPMPAYDVETEHRYHRQLEVSIQQATDGKRLFDVTVRNVSRQMSTPAVMPALVQSAFHDFPGPNGGARVIELQQPKNGAGG